MPPPSPGSRATTPLLSGQSTPRLLYNGTDTPPKSPRRPTFQNPTLRKTSYYVPVISWAPTYSLSLFWGDLVAGLTLASICVPMSLSYATVIAKIPAVNGLYGSVIPPLVYAVFGSCRQLNVSPEAALSLFVAEAIRTQLPHDATVHEKVVLTGIITWLAGAITLAAGVMRFGFLDGVLSRALLRGFISAVGVVIIIDQSLICTGLTMLAEQSDIHHKSTLAKGLFVLRSLGSAHRLTTLVALSAFTILVTLRVIKAKLQPRYPGMVYIPEILLVVISFSLLADYFDWDAQGVSILGKVKSSNLVIDPFPPRAHNFKHVRTVLSTSFLCATLGFFESLVAGKSLGPRYDYSVSANRELVALGAANVLGGMFGTLPAFGGYGRSKINALTGARTQMCGVILAILVVLSTRYLMPMFFYLPKCVLAAIISVVAWGLCVEAPDEIAFFVRVGGWRDLAFIALTFFLSVFWSLELGIAVGVGLSLVLVVKHSTSPRIQILGRVRGTSGQFANAENDAHSRDDDCELEDVEGCLIVKVPEPLTFANTGQLRDRLRRLELYGHPHAHPSHEPTRSPHHNANIIFDLGAMSHIDTSAIQILLEVVTEYEKSGSRVWFARVRSGGEVWSLCERSGIVGLLGGWEGGRFCESVERAVGRIDRGREMSAGSVEEV
ncbi:hypothetical protein G7K_6760-t1 [Saitoella complicata NRRL Y-17804]|uniref:STAS domain-containing protein n=2 Tax=Saitoella complicata (strain BCRC 22490 / CBS 7301 / JCM 7358 / NBRC 10748 / NRRL Y-17804) TaxID=698492 RepID=A0A0E9NS35_SAICN|nr:hypothetical protein G7K_6760-t1 [Saitoella complicata NRRL Y-17804]